MYRKNKRVLFVAVVVIVSLAGVVAFQQMKLLRLHAQNAELAASNSEKETEMSNLISTHNEQIKDLNNTLSEKITNLTSICDWMNVSYFQALNELQQVNDILNSSVPTILFDKNVYFPPVNAFWEQNVLTPIGVKVVDPNVSSNFVTVKILSRIDFKLINLSRVDSAGFFGMVHAIGLRPGEPVTNSSNFNVEYGDMIIASYLDHVSSHIIATIAALFVLPEHVNQKIFTNPDVWKLFDKEGIPIVDYGEKIGIQYNPVTVSQYALAQYQAYLRMNRETFKERFLSQANWLVRNAQQKGNFTVWEYCFNWSDFRATAPFVSAMAQGEGLSVLARAYLLTRNVTYIEVAETSMKSFEVEMNLGGVRYTDYSGIWFEEYADTDTPSSKVLNGFIFSLLGLYEYSFVTNSSTGYALFREGIQTLLANLNRYDTGSWSLYDLLHHNLASLDYHKLHVELLKTLHEITNFDTFQFYSDKFQSYIQ